MDHVAIMRKSWGLLPKILSGEKTIESRWYKNKSAPWGTIRSGDTVYFKNSGEKVKAKAKVKEVKEIEGLDPDKVRDTLETYGEKDGIDNIQEYFYLFKNKRYCILVFLESAVTIDPFEIDKKGFGAMAAWISVPDINKIRLR